MSHKQQQDLEGDFAAGRQDAFDEIRRAFTGRRVDYAPISVDDHFGLGLKPEQKQIITEVVARPFLDHFKTYVTKAIDALQSGHDVLSLTGHEAIKGYTHITSGDYNAGFRSSAEDLKVLLIALDLNEVVESFVKNLSVKGELAAIFEEGNQSQSALLEGEGPTEKVSAIVSRFLLGAMASDWDGHLQIIEGRYLQKKPLPYVVGYSGQDPEKLSFRFLRVVMQHMYEPMNRLSRLKGKVPTSWPPFKVQDEFSAAAAAANDNNDNGADTAMTIEAFLAQEEETPVNEHKAFQQGFLETLQSLYLEAQKVHFSILHEKSYNEVLGISDYWSDSVRIVTEQCFADIRNDMVDRMDRPARGEGETYQDGREAAMNWAVQRFKAADVRSHEQDRAAHLRILNQFKAFWVKQVVILVVINDQPVQEDVDNRMAAPKAMP